MTRILDSSFIYTPACKTDIRETFERARQQMKAAPQAVTPRVSDGQVGATSTAPSLPPAVAAPRIRRVA